MLTKIKYEEFFGTPRHWKMHPLDLQQINLVVGKNATGKTRLINVLSGFYGILAGKHPGIFESAKYEAEIVLGGKKYEIILHAEKGRVIEEKICVDGVTQLERNSDGQGRIFYAKEGIPLSFQAPEAIYAVQQKRDKLQHPFMEEIAVWASFASSIYFSSTLGKEISLGLQNIQQILATDGPIDLALVGTYTKGYDRFKEDFDQSIIADMKTIGYDLLEVGATDLRAFSPQFAAPEPVLTTFVREQSRPEGMVLQGDMSQGMFRALALVVFVNYAKFSSRKITLLVDDMGEGLDFERATGLLDVLCSHAKSSDWQLVMTTNDRFIMNRVPLEHWCLLHREGAEIHAVTERNSPEKFRKFKFMGLSNFEFFASEQTQNK